MGEGFPCFSWPWVYLPLELASVPRQGDCPGEPPSAGRHFSSGSSILNSCWEQLGLHTVSEKQLTNASMLGFLRGVT